MAVEFTGHMDVTVADAIRVQIPVTLSNVNYAPTIRHNLFSTSAAIRAGATVVLNSENGRTEERGGCVWQVFALALALAHAHTCTRAVRDTRDL
jgi:hypothetical protein